MSDLKKHVAVGSTSFIVGAVIPALISLNIFARSEELAKLETRMYRDFVQKEDLEKWVQSLDKRLAGIESRLEKIADRK